MRIGELCRPYSASRDWDDFLFPGGYPRSVIYFRPDAESFGEWKEQPARRDRGRARLFVKNGAIIIRSVNAVSKFERIFRGMDIV